MPPPGYPAPPYPAYPAPAPAPAPKKKRTGLKILLGIVAAFVVIIIVAVAATGGAAKADYYKVGGDQVPSVKLALEEERKVTSTTKSTSNGVTSQITVYKSSSPQDDVNAYVAYLKANDGFSFRTDADGDELFGRDSKDQGYVLNMEITYDSEGYTVTLERLKGSFGSTGEDETRAQPETRDPLPYNNDPTTRAQQESKFSENDDYYILGSDRVPTVKKALGFRSVVSSIDLSYGGAVSMQAEYRSDTPNQDCYDYVDYLEEADDFICLEDVDFADASGTAYFGRNSTVRSGYKITVTVKWNATGYTVTVEQAEGEIISYG